MFYLEHLFNRQTTCILVLPDCLLLCQLHPLWHTIPTNPQGIAQNIGDDLSEDKMLFFILLAAST